MGITELAKRSISSLASVLKKFTYDVAALVEFGIIAGSLIIFPVLIPAAILFMMYSRINEQTTSYGRLFLDTLLLSAKIVAQSAALFVIRLFKTVFYNPFVTLRDGFTKGFSHFNDIQYESFSAKIYLINQPPAPNAQDEKPAKPHTVPDHVIQDALTSPDRLSQRIRQILPPNMQQPVNYLDEFKLAQLTREANESSDTARGQQIHTLVTRYRDICDMNKSQIDFVHVSANTNPMTVRYKLNGNWRHIVFDMDILIRAIEQQERISPLSETRTIPGIERTVHFRQLETGPDNMLQNDDFEIVRGLDKTEYIELGNIINELNAFVREIDARQTQEQAVGNSTLTDAGSFEIVFGGGSTT